MLAGFLDIKKAYDTVDRKMLARILERLGLDGKILNWLKQFLLGKRSGKVIYEGCKSEDIFFERGVPQGSPLSPLLFNIYIREIEDFNEQKILQFADDVVIWERDKDAKAATDRINARLSRINQWSKEVGLAFSPQKCKVIIFSRKNKLIRHPVYFGEDILQYTKEVKYLGLSLDERLTWRKHVNNVVEKCNKRIGLLRYLCNKNNLNQKIAITLYKTLIRPVIEYGIEIYGDVYKTGVKKLESIQHRSLTTALGVNRLAHRRHVEIETGVEPLLLRFDIKIFKTYQRIRIRKQLKNLIKVKNKNRLKFSSKKSFKEKISDLKKKYKNILNANEKDLQEMIQLEWKKTISATKYETRNECYTENNHNKIEYKEISQSRKINKVWYQARLGVMQSKEFLKSIGRSKEEKCSKCGETETLEHILLKCKEYEDIRENRINELKVLLNQDRPPPEKVQTAQRIAEIFSRRKRGREEHT